jgi:hypothetical protein
MTYEGNTFFDVHVPQFSMEDLGRLFPPEVMLKVLNWIQAGYVKPDYWKDPRGGKDRRRFSIVEITRIAIIDSLVNGIGIKPSQAVEVADFCIPFLNETFDRDAAQELKSTALVYVMTWLGRSDGKMQSTVYYRKLDDPILYDDNPDSNPDAEPLAPPAGVAIHLPLTNFFDKVFLDCAALLTQQKRGGMDKFRRPVSAE